MKALINCRKLQQNLAPIWTGSAYLMPICNRPLLDYWLDLCIWLDIREVLFIEYEAHLKAAVRSEDWGLELRFELAHPEDVLPDILGRYRDWLTEDLLVIDGPVFPFYDKQQLKQGLIPQRESAIFCLDSTQLKLEESLLIFPQPALDYLLSAQDDGERFQRWTSLPLDRHPSLHFPIALPKQLPDYVELNYRVLQAHRQFQLKGFEVAPGIYEGLHNEIVSRPALDGPLLTGEKCTLGPRVSLQNVVLHNQVRLEGNCQLKRCMVWGPVFLGDVQLEDSLIIQNQCLNPKTGEVQELKQNYRLKEQLQSLEQKQARYAQDAAQARRLLRWRSPAYQALRWFIPESMRKYYLNSHGETLIVPHYSLPPDPSALQEQFFRWNLHRVPLLQAVKEQRLLLVGNRLLPAQSLHLNFIQKLPIYAPGAFCLSETLTMNSIEHWIEELYYTSQVSPEMDTEIIKRAFERDRQLQELTDINNE